MIRLITLSNEIINSKISEIFTFDQQLATNCPMKQ